MMEQITQKLRTGRTSLTEVPMPEPKKGEILVRNTYSCVSPGTESSTIRAAKKGYIGKAKERPEQFRQVLDKLKTQGLVQTYRAVTKKLDAYSPLGYSCVGMVVEIATDVKGFSVGDYVACGGGSACHSEFVCVPENLCVRLPQEIDLKQAAYNTLGAIAMQGVRQSDVRLGEVCAVIGLGVLGQLTCVLLNAAGIKVIGIDVNPATVKMAEDHCADQAYLRSDAVIEQRIFNLSNGVGCDAVIITAASDSVDPINFAGAIARKRGTIVIVGSVPTGFDREPHFYKKELTVKMSCSYGPGRYDPMYEEKNQDYPCAYVRWTENRNMQAFQDLIASKRIDISYLTTHVFKLEDAPEAYDMILDKSEPFAGILIEYESAKEIRRERIEVSKIKEKIKQEVLVVSIGFIGAGSYAQGYLLPNIPKGNHVALKGVLTKTPAGSRSVADRFGFEFCTSKAEDIFEDDEINTVFIATRHDSHGKYVIDALKARKHIYVEKPLCLKLDELNEIAGLMEKMSEGVSPFLMVGYNRRFSPLSNILKNILKNEPMAMIYRINAGSIPADSWIQDLEFGGGRLIGEVCHFIDYLTFLNGSMPISVYSVAMREPTHLNDTLSISIRYQNGSIGNIHYFANGSKAVPKEYVEIYQSGVTILLNDFREISIFDKGKPSIKKLLAQDKGQKKEVHQFIEAIKGGKCAPIPFEEIYNTSVVSFKILESLKSGITINV
jgi:predicted dehydrogenase/threonine dehydrogenase-like Zn-dependent dehydrogenase